DADEGCDTHLRHRARVHILPDIAFFLRGPQQVFEDVEPIRQERLHLWSQLRVFTELPTQACDRARGRIGLVEVAGLVHHLDQLVEGTFSATGRFDRLRGPLLLLRAEHFEGQRFLRWEVEVEGPLGETGRRDDVVQGGSGVAGACVRVSRLVDVASPGAFPPSPDRCRRDHVGYLHTDGSVCQTDHFRTLTWRCCARARAPRHRTTVPLLTTL